MKQSLTVLLILALLVSASSDAAEPPRPNILFIAVDDLRPEIGAYGVNRAVTPNIDALAAKSVRFDRAYVTYPLCLPSRASMLTGRRIDYSGDGKKRDFGTLIQLQQTWPATFRKAGYWTATSGKLYHGGVPKVDTAAWDVPGEMWRNGFRDWSPELMKRVVAEAGPKHSGATSPPFLSMPTACRPCEPLSPTPGWAMSLPKLQPAPLPNRN